MEKIDSVWSALIFDKDGPCQINLIDKRSIKSKLKAGEGRKLVSMLGLMFDPLPT